MSSNTITCKAVLTALKTRRGEANRWKAFEAARAKDAEHARPLIERFQAAGLIDHKIELTPKGWFVLRYIDERFFGQPLVGAWKNWQRDNVWGEANGYLQASASAAGGTRWSYVLNRSVEPLLPHIMDLVWR